MDEETGGQDLGAFTGEACSWYDIPCNATNFAEWLVGIFLYLPRLLFSGLADAVAAAISALNLAGGLDVSMAGFFAEAGPGAIYFANMLALSEGLGIIFGAYLVRFTLRALPAMF